MADLESGKKDRRRTSLNSLRRQLRTRRNLVKILVLAIKLAWYLYEKFRDNPWTSCPQQITTCTPGPPPIRHAESRAVVWT